MSNQALMVRKLPGGVGVAAGAQASFSIPLGRRYHQLVFEYSGVTLAQMQNIEVRLNGVTFQKFRSGTELEVFSQFYGLPVQAGRMVLDFERMGLLNAANRAMTCVDTTRPGEGVIPQTFDIVMDIDGAATAPAFDVYGFTSVGNPSNNARVLKKIRTHSINVSATGDFEISDVVRSNVIAGIAFDTSTVDFDNIEIEINGLKILDAPKAQLNHIQDRGILVPQANWFIYDFGYSGFGDRILNAAGSQDFRVRLNATSTGALPYSVFYLGQLER